jgi:hypothetical protein
MELNSNVIIRSASAISTGSNVDLSTGTKVDLADALKPADFVVHPGINYFLTCYGIDGVSTISVKASIFDPHSVCKDSLSS